ncbi:hypothetical protein [Thermogemmatispora sp.]|uniref:hypothetical protein n=1 Tax=Thermogemmatispora sp. TaxID=1968838 RepID=UPI0035E4077B
MSSKVLSLGQTLPPADLSRRLRFAAGGLTIAPNPPRVGETATIYLHVCNETGEPLQVRKIRPSVYSFGVGFLESEPLPEQGPLTLPADPTCIEVLTWQWLPLVGGHRCLRVELDIEGWLQPLIVGCNLQVIEAEAESYRWRVPFLLANPTRKAQPLRLQLHTQSLGLEARAFRFWVELAGDGSRWPLGRPLWLRPREERGAFLLIRAHPLDAGAFRLTGDIEAWLGGQFLDGIRVIVSRSAPVELAALPEAGQTEAILVAGGCSWPRGNEV